MRLLVTGAHGFLGWHLRCRLRALTDHDVVGVGRHDWNRLSELVAASDAVMHLAGVNRGDPDEVESGNVALAHDVARALRARGGHVPVVYANSIHAGADTAYGRGKAEAARLLERTVSEAGGVFTDVRLPNLFGEHGRPGYNSFVATFAHAVHDGAPIDLIDREVELLHAQPAAASLIEHLGDTGSSVVEPRGTVTSVGEVLRAFEEFKKVYREGDVPALTSDLRLALFNTYRAAAFPVRHPVPLVRRTDERGHLVEVVRAHGGQGQTFVSTTRPGVTRGEHFHLRKVERFAVIGGRARISLRRLFTTDVVHFDVSGDEPVVVDMPTMWAHNITNTGDSDLSTVFWTQELFDPADTDTFPEPVSPRPLAAGSADGH